MNGMTLPDTHMLLEQELIEARTVGGEKLFVTPSGKVYKEITVYQPVLFDVAIAKNKKV